MARKDEIFKTFMEHPILQEKYSIDERSVPKTVAEGITCDIPMVKSIALIVSNLEVPAPVNDNTLRTIVTNYLNTAI
jgi:hypothetical protein